MNTQSVEFLPPPVIITLRYKLRKRTKVHCRACAVLIRLSKSSECA